MPRTKEAEEVVTESPKGLGPYVVHTPFKGAAFTKPSDSPSYRKLLELAAEPGGLREDPSYSKRVPPNVEPIPEMFHTDAQLKEAYEKAKIDGRIADAEGRFWCWSEDQAAEILKNYMSIDPSCKKNWPYGKEVRLDSVSPKFVKDKLHHLSDLLSDEEKDIELEKRAIAQANSKRNSA